MNITIILLLIIILQISVLLLRPVLSKRQISRIRKRSVFVDTSALMDGRILTAARTGFLPYDIVVPKSVVAELQLLADQADNEKRARARHGLDCLKELQEIEQVRTIILDDGRLSDGGVDARLVELAMKYDGWLCTIDFNLNKVAAVNGVFVLNINDLAGTIRMAFLPGETISLPLTQKGQSSSQAVGYLADGTMVVVDKAAAYIGKTAEIEFIRSLQTAAGRMMFAKLTKQNGSRAEEASSDASQAAKPIGRRKPTNTTNSQESSAATTQKPRRAQSRNPRKNHEDDLINLVNNQ